jgi:hypothetical protein
MARFVPWLGNMGTIKASSLHPYLSAVTTFYKDQGREPVALRDLVARVPKRLAPSQVALTPTLIRVALPSARSRAHRNNVRNTSSHYRQRTMPQDRASTSLYRYYRRSVRSLRGGAGIECLISDLVTS